MNEVDSVFLYDIDDLGKVVDENLRGRVETAKDAEAIVCEEVDRMVLRLKTRDARPNPKSPPTARAAVSLVVSPTPRPSTWPP